MQTDCQILILFNLVDIKTVKLNMALESHEREMNTVEPSCNPFDSFRHEGDFPSSLFGYSFSSSSEVSDSIHISSNDSTHIYMNLLDESHSGMVKSTKFWTTDLESDYESVESQQFANQRASCDGKVMPAYEKKHVCICNRCTNDNVYSKVMFWLCNQHVNQTKNGKLKSSQIQNIKKNLKKVAKALKKTRHTDITLTTLAVL